jgi:hypothetical protein
MADRIPAEIWIGGRLPRSLLEEFPISDLRVDWDENPADASSEEGILAGRDKDGLLHFADAEAAWGEFVALEDWLRGHKLPFRRRSAERYEYLPEIVESWPDLGKELETIASDDGEPLIHQSALVSILDRMAKLQCSDRPLLSQVRAWRRLYGKLTKLVPPKLPPLPRFQIVDG